MRKQDQLAAVRADYELRLQHNEDTISRLENELRQRTNEVSELNTLRHANEQLKREIAGFERVFALIERLV